MGKAPSMRQKHYNEALRGLGIAMAVFRELTDSEEKAREAFKSFVAEHYVPVWLEIDDIR